MNDNNRTQVVDFRAYVAKKVARKRNNRQLSTVHRMLYVMMEIVAQRRNMRFNFLHALIAAEFKVASIDELHDDNISDAILFLTIMLNGSASAP